MVKVMVDQMVLIKEEVMTGELVLIKEVKMAGIMQGSMATVAERRTFGIVTHGTAATLGKVICGMVILQNRNMIFRQANLTKEEETKHFQTQNMAEGNLRL